MADDFDTDTTDDGGDAGQETNLVKDLRRQLRQANKELGELRPYRDQRVLQQAGFDPESKQGKALLRLHDGELTADALKATAEEYGFAAAETAEAETVDPAAQQRSDATQRIDDLRSNATPVGEQRLTSEETQELRRTNPAAAVAAMRDGKAELPSHVMEAVLANRAERAQQIV